MKGCDRMFLYYDKTIVDVTLPDFWRCRGGSDGCFLDYLHAEICNNRANRAAHCATMDLFVDGVIVNEVIV